MSRFIGAQWSNLGRKKDIPPEPSKKINFHTENNLQIVITYLSTLPLKKMCCILEKLNWNLSRVWYTYLGWSASIVWALRNKQSNCFIFSYQHPLWGGAEDCLWKVFLKISPSWLLEKFMWYHRTCSSFKKNTIFNYNT